MLHPYYYEDYKYDVVPGYDDNVTHIPTLAFEIRKMYVADGYSVSSLRNNTDDTYSSEMYTITLYNEEGQRVMMSFSTLTDVTIDNWLDIFLNEAPPIKVEAMYHYMITANYGMF